MLLECIIGEGADNSDIAKSSYILYQQTVVLQPRESNLL